MLGPMLLSWHNLTYYQDLMSALRAAILTGRLAETAAALRADWVDAEESI
jgi:queuine tRNA-ribosyltransferase